ncbi:MAG: hypothetical protein KF752_17500 [Pirellulaceae bacterium]|nr:hypothetical protein [Pirellulaceae bacterium]
MIHQNSLTALLLLVLAMQPLLLQSRQVFVGQSHLAASAEPVGESSESEKAGCEPSFLDAANIQRLDLSLDNQIAVCLALLPDVPAIGDLATCIHLRGPPSRAL